MAMELPSVCGSSRSPGFELSNFGFYLSPSNEARRPQSCRLRNPAKSSVTGLRCGNKESLVPKLRKTIATHASDRDHILPASESTDARVPKYYDLGFEPFRGKSGSVSFHGLTYQSVEESQLISSPFKLDDGSFLWLVAPAALISALLLPPPFITYVVETTINNEAVAELVACLSADAFFYAGVAAFLLITDLVQRPYLQFSAKRWSLITGLNGYLTAFYLVASLKVIASLLFLSTWPVLSLQSLVPAVPFLVSILAQIAFEIFVDKRGLSCWPLVPIIFEGYRLCQLSRASSYIKRLMFEMQNLPVTPELGPKSDALVAVFVSTQVLGIICLWSLLLFLLRLFPSRPVSENY
ncbi:hypothetical protein Dimus_025602 [Dionaea muscipula]